MSKYNRIQIDFVVRLVESGVKTNHATKQMCKRFDIDYTNNVRDYFRKLVKLELDDSVIAKTSSDNKPKSTVKKYVKALAKPTEFVMSAWKKDGTMMTLTEYCKHYGLETRNIKSHRLADRKGVPYYSMSYKSESTIVLEDNVFDTSFLEAVVKKHIKDCTKPVKTEIKGKTFDRVVYTDVHIGMSTNKEGNAMYATEWNKNKLMEQMDEMVRYILNNQKSDVLYIDELGDFLDGWDGYTTRGGHKLPQNMTNKECFDAGVEFKVKMVDKLINHYKYIQLNNICEDNHSGDFGYMVNSTVKSILEMKYLNVSVNNMVQFLNVYYVGKHGFALTHGKDSKSLKFGFKPVLDPKQIEKLDGFLKKYDVYKKATFIEVSKGDSHQSLIDKATSDDFDYCNYMAFSPSSEWVQVNFKQGRRGFSFQTIEYHSNVKTCTDVWFK